MKKTDHRSNELSAGLVSSAVAAILALGMACAGAANAQPTAPAAGTTTTAAGAAPAGGPQSTADPSTADAAASAMQLQEVVVTGYRNSLQQALRIKEDMASEVDTILAEDIGKFPDQNLAESLQRIPGVAITREQGEGREITVRGLGPQFTRVRVNGMETLTTTGGPDNEGGVNRTRAFDFNIFSSDLFNELTVRKTSEADVDEGSLGATVDLTTAHPLDYHKFVFITQAKGNYNDLSGTVGPQVSGLISNVFDDGKFGALASVSWSKRDYLDDGASTVRWDEGKVLKTGTNPYGASPYGFASVGGTPCIGTASTLPAACQAADSALHPRFPRYDNFQDGENRLGLTGSLQWKPNAANLLSLDLLHSYYAETRQEQYLEAPGFSGQGKCTNPAKTVSIGCISVLSDTIDGAGVMTAGTFSGVDTRVEDRFDSMHTNFTQVTLNGNHDLGEKWSIDELLGYSRSLFNNPQQTTLGWDQYGQTVSYDFASRIPYLNFGTENVGATGPWLLTEVRERPQSTTNDFKDVELNVHFTPDDTVNFAGGLQLKQYDFGTTSLRLVNGETVNSKNAYSGLQSVPIGSYAQTVNFGSASGVPVPGGSTAAWATPSVFLAQNALGIYSNGSLFALSTAGDLGNNVRVRERDSGAYLQMNWDAHLLSRELRGNLGVRVVRTSQWSQGYSSTLLPITASRDYNDVLPALNLVWSLRSDLLLRFAASRDMSRPNLTDVAASTSVSVSGTQFNVKTGNPSIDPFLANAYDLSLEWYPAPGTLVSVAPFRKDVLSFSSSETINTVFHGNPFGVPDSLAIQACGSTPGCSPDATWAFSVPVNSPGGKVNGVELNYQQPLRFLPGFLHNLGVQMNYTYVTSTVKYLAGPNTYVTGELEGLSKNTAGATLYYEDPKWSVRVSGAYRSAYLIRVPGQETGTDADGYDATFNLDASVQYNLTERFRLTLEGVNLTDQYESEFDDTARDLVYYYHNQGREILFGVRYQY
ncbi:MAG TPA: TonB-dependent receptor [Steroidobacteraceae bacterium]|nr:TonB-dependent receptor [Steroidobacteraceae bacterium]